MSPANGKRIPFLIASVASATYRWHTWVLSALPCIMPPLTDLRWDVKLFTRTTWFLDEIYKP